MIDGDKLAEKLRAKSIDVSGMKLLVSRLQGSKQESDLTAAPNCGGFGRIRHFKRATSAGWPTNPLPIDPACFKLGLKRTDILEAQVFQNASCNWRCWFCFVPFDLLSADMGKSAWFSASELIDLYFGELTRPSVIDLTGGQPDLVPEWVAWMMEELERRKLSTEIYLWSDDNLSNDYFWRHLSAQQIMRIRDYRNYGKVCCFKGFDERSFQFNTDADAAFFDEQFRHFKKYVELGIDVYAYATFTAQDDQGLNESMSIFVDRLQEIHPNLPLRTVPLEISTYSAMKDRMNAFKNKSLSVQWQAIECWNGELTRRFPEELRERPIYEIPIWN